MRRRAAWLVVTGGLALCASGCGEDRLERGLTDGPEDAVPAVSSEFEMTEAERQRKFTELEQKREESMIEDEEERRRAQ